MKRRVYIGIGSNHDAARNLRAAMRLLRARTDFVAASPVYETAAIGKTAGGALYLNAVVIIETERTPESLRAGVLENIERQLLRSRADTGKVTVDLDVLRWENAAGGDAIWACLPEDLDHPHVAVPLADVAPALLHPAALKPMQEVAARFRRMPGIRLCTDVHL